MPIVGLTGRGAKFPEIGKLFKGAKKEKKVNKEGREYETFGKELDYWRFESNEPHIVEAFHAAFDEQPREIPVYLPFPQTGQNFEAWKEAYTAGGISHRCDGVECNLWFDEKSATYQTGPKPCPTLEMTPEKAKRDGCKPVARLRVVIPALNQIGYVTVETHSKHDILHLDSALPAYESLRPEEGLRGIPMLLCRVQKEISTPGDGKRTRRPKWLIELKPHPEWAALYLDSQRQAALAAAAESRLLTTDLPEEEDTEPETLPVEARVSIETLEAIDNLWPLHGSQVDGKIIPLADYLRKTIGINDPREMSASQADTTKKWLQKRALDASSLGKKKDKQPPADQVNKADREAMSV